MNFLKLDSESFRISLSLLAIFALQIFAPLRIAAQDSRQLQREKSSTTDNKSAEKRTALVIGNSTYQTSPLTNPANDATDMAAALKTLDFEVISGVNQSRAEIVRLIRQFGERLKANGGVGLFYYAGHGVQVEGRNYLIPVDAQIRSENEVELEAVDVARVLVEMENAGNALNIVILDACRNNPFSRSWRSTNDGLAQINAPSGTLIAYSTAPGKVASDGAGRNAPYTAALLKALKIPDLSLSDVFMQVRAEVQKVTNKQQTPWEASSVTGKFYFKSGNLIDSNKTVEPNITVKDKAAQEREAWDLVKNSSDAEDFRLFLKEFPNGANAEKAKIRLEEITWESVRNSNDKTKVQAYLNEFPTGANAAAGRIKLRQLEAASQKPTPQTNNPVKNRTDKTVNANLTAGVVSTAKLPNGDEMDFVYIPAGDFMMGSNNGSNDEKPVHKVTISQPFWMGRTEVTQAQWEKVMSSNPSNFKGCPNCPVEQVSWDDAQQFIATLNAQNDGFTYRLPTEAEWEYAARAGTTGDYAGSLDAMAWYSVNSEDKTHEVGTKQANAWGLYDMHGNVWEWVQDWYSDNYYSNSPIVNPTGASSGSLRVLRGGGWGNPAEGLRSAVRYCLSSSLRRNGLGFRVVRK